MNEEVGTRVARALGQMLDRAQAGRYTGLYCVAFDDNGTEYEVVINPSISTLQRSMKRRLAELHAANGAMALVEGLSDSSAFRDLCNDDLARAQQLEQELQSIAERMVAEDDTVWGIHDCDM